VIALINATETEIIGRRYLKINNSSIKEYFAMKFCVVILLKGVEIWYFYQILSGVYIFPDTV